MQLHRHALRVSLAATVISCLAACGDDKSAPDTDDTTTAATTAVTAGTDASTGPGTTESVTTGMTQDASTSEPSTADATTSEPSTTEVTAATTTEPDTTGTTGMTGMTGTTGTTGQSGLSFAADVYSVLNPPTSCDCHTPGSGGLKMGDADTAYANLVGVMSTESPLKRVEPGSAADSYMWHKISGTHLDVGGSGKAMPLGAPPLPQETIDLIKEWIDGGAQP